MTAFMMLSNHIKSYLEIKIHFFLMISLKAYITYLLYHHSYFLSPHCLF